MKLTKQQLDTLANKIYEEVREKKLAEKEAVKQECINSNQNVIDELFLLYSTIFNVLDTELIYSLRIEKYGREYRDSEDLKESLVNNLISKNLDLSAYIVSGDLKTKIHQELVLATIECDNVQELIDSVKSKF